jgi:hypothetical protein
MDKFRLQEQENGSIVLNVQDTELENTSGDGHGGGGASEREELKVIVDELNKRFHFEFEDRDKVMRIVIPKLVNDEGLVAAFQTNNIESLRRQKFADSLENAFISSAGDFYAVLNRMATEPDFKRLMTEFALGEFKRGLAGAEAAKTQGSGARMFDSQENRAKAYVARQFGGEVKWARINAALWEAMRKRTEHSITLTSVDSVAKVAGSEPNDVLAVLALFSRPGLGLLALEYSSDSDTKVSREQLAQNLKAWWKDREMTDDQWRSWAGRVVVKWSPILEVAS